MGITLDTLDTAVKFAKDIEALVATKGTSYMEAIQLWCEQRDLEIEYAASLIKKNKNLKGKVQLEAEQLNYMKKTSRLPV
jgi:hypothetical protein